MPEPRELILGCCLDGGGTVPEVRHGDAAGEVEIALAVRVGDPTAVTFDDFDLRIGGDDGGHDVAEAGGKVGHGDPPCSGRDVRG